jgi:hypothetical protein
MIANFKDLVSRYLRIPGDKIEAFLADVKPAYERYKNTGIRIEDDILITEDGYRVLSSSAPKTIKAIETMMEKKSIFNK